MRDGPPDGPVKWWGDPLAWVELFALSNVAFLAADIALAHAVNAFAHPAEYVPVAFSLVAPAVLVAAMALGGLRAGAGRRGRAPAGWRAGSGWPWGGARSRSGSPACYSTSTARSSTSRRSRTWCTPPRSPRRWPTRGSGSCSSSTVWWIRGRSTGHAGSSCSHSGGFAGNFVLTLADHAQNGFFRPSEWIGVIASAWAVSSLCAVLVVYDNRPLLGLALVVMAAQVGVGMLGFYLHVMADLRSPAGPLWDRILYGAPLFAPLLFADLAMLAALALWAVARTQATAGGQGQAEPSR